MSHARLFRLVHYWGSVLLLITTVVVATTGILLALRKDFPALQPPQQRSAVGALSDRPISAIVRAVTMNPDFRWVTEDDVDRLDIRPSLGLAKVILKDHTEVQVDLHTMEVLQVGYRASDVLELIHSGTIFGDWGKYVWAVPTGVALLVLWATGAYLFAWPFIVRARTRKPGRTGPASELRQERGRRRNPPPPTL
jgi:uncharacterized iron-regulated membrane protein